MNDRIDTDFYIRINEIKNYLYCPRIPYYSLCLRIDRETDLSRAGIAGEQQAKQRMKRRKYALHAAHDGQRQFDVSLVSHQYRVLGRLDEMVVTTDGVYLVDYKDTGQDYGYWRLQMLAYQLAAEEAGKRVIGRYVYVIEERRYIPVEIKSADWAKLTATLEALQQMIIEENCPPPVEQVGKCRSCQYARFCNDVL